MNIEAFVLIGGRSRRFGRDKALVRIGGMTLAERALTTIRASGTASKIYFVAGNEMQFAIEAAMLAAPFVFDIVEGRGPLGGLHSALSNATSEWIFLLACDYPLITPEFIRVLHGKVSDEVGAVVPEQPDGRLQPLCAFYKVKAALPVVDEIIHRRRASPPMHEVVNRLGPLVVRPTEYSDLTGFDRLFANTNTADDVKNAAEILEKISQDLA